MGKTSQPLIKSALKKDGLYLSVKSPTNEKIENLIFIKELIEAGEINAVNDRTYPLEDMVATHRYVVKGHKKVNVIITMAHDGKS